MVALSILQEVGIFYLVTTILGVGAVAYGVLTAEKDPEDR